MAKTKDKRYTFLSQIHAFNDFPEFEFHDSLAARNARTMHLMIVWLETLGTGAGTRGPSRVAMAGLDKADLSQASARTEAEKRALAQDLETERARLERLQSTAQMHEKARGGAFETLDSACKGVGNSHCIWCM